MSQTTTISVGGMTCTGCSGNVSSALSVVEGITSVEVSHETGLAVIEHDGADRASMVKAILESGYSVDGEEAPFDWTDGPVWRQSAHNTCLLYTSPSPRD